MNNTIRKLEATVARLRKNVKPTKAVRAVVPRVTATPVYKAGKREEVIYNAFSAREHESFQAMGELMLRTGR